MLSPELPFKVSEFIAPTDAKPSIPREAPVRREDPEIPNPTQPRIPEPIRFPERPIPQEPRIPAPKR